MASQQVSLLFEAAKENNVNMIRDILHSMPNKEMKKNMLNAINETDGRTALHVACHFESEEAMFMLLEAGCELNLQDFNGDTALHIVIVKKNIGGTSVLISRLSHADRNTRNKIGRTPLHNAVAAQVTCKMFESILAAHVFELNLKDNAGHTAFHLAVASGYMTQAKVILKVDPDVVNQPTDSGEYPLWLALRNKQLDMVKYLIEHGANVNVGHKKFGHSVLWLAVDMQNEAAVDLILDADAKCDNEIFLLSLGRESKNIQAKIMARTDAKLKILFNLLSEKEVEALDPNFTDEDGNSLHHLAVMSDSCEMVMKIFVTCRDVGKKNAAGKTASDLASERGIRNIMDFLQVSPAEKSSVIFNLKEIFKLSEEYPIFTEDSAPPLKGQPDHLGNIAIEELEHNIVGPVDIDWYGKLKGDGTILSLAEQTLHTRAADDNSNTYLVKSILKVMYDIEQYLNQKSDLFRHLNVAFFPVGSVVEGTKVGLLNELDFGACLRNLNDFTVTDGKSMVVNPKVLAGFSKPVMELFDGEGKLNLLKLFIAFIGAVGDAVKSISQMPDNIEKFSETCQFPECQEKEYVIGMQKQCSHLKDTPPCVCFTKVGASLNFVCKNADVKNLFTVDLVLIFQVQSQDMHAESNMDVKKSLLRYLITEHPPGWNRFLHQFMTDEQAFKQMSTHQARHMMYGIKMIGYTGNFVVRPGLFLDVKNTLENHNLRRAYSIMKLLRIYSDSKVKSYDIKKVICELRKQMENEEDVYKMVQTVLQHKEMLGRFDGICSVFRKNFVAVDYKDLPKQVEGTFKLHFVRTDAHILHDCIEMEQVEEVKQLLPLNELLNEEAYSIHGKYPLHWACEAPIRPHPLIIKHLIQAGCNINGQDLNGNTPLHMLICNGLTTRQCLDMIMEMNPNIETCNKEGYNPIKTGIHALEEEHYGCEQMEILVEWGKDQEGICGSQLHSFACRLGKFKFSKILFSHIADINTNYAEEDGRTPVLHASRFGDWMTVKFIILNGATVDLCDYEGVSALYEASDKGHEAVVEVLLCHIATVDLPSKEKMTPLMIAAKNGHEGIVQKLLDNGASPSFANRRGFNSLHFASQGGYLSIVKMLLETGMNVDVTITLGFTSLHMASQEGHLHVARYLVEEAGATVNWGNVTNDTPLHTACYRNNLELTLYLLASGAQINARTVANQTPLFYACQQGNIDVAKCLLEAGADRCIVSQSHTPRDIARMNGFSEIERLFEMSDD